MKAAFADRYYWIALANPRDDAHSQVVEYLRRRGRDPIVTTDEVLTQFLAFCASDAALRVEAAGIVQDILRSSRVHVFPQTRASFLAGLELYCARPDKGYSLTDCISMQTMRRAGLFDALTNDRHFLQEGFRALFREP